MNKVKIALLSILIFFISLPVYTQVSTCNSVYNFLKINKCNISQHQLVTSNINNFPYNLSVNYPQKNNKSNNFLDTPKNLYLFFNQEDVLSNQDVFSQLFDYLKTSDFDFNINLVFLYGENQEIQKKYNIYGLDSFLKTINTNENSTIIYVNMNQNRNSIISASNGIISPSWLIKNEHDIFIKYNISTYLPFFYISQANKNNFIKNRELSSIFNEGIPSIVLNINSQDFSSSNTIANILTESIENFSKIQNQNWDQHFLMLRLFGKYSLISENKIVRIIIFNFFLFLFFLIFLGFINKRLRKEAWNKMKKIWYVVPITFFITVFSFFIGKIIISNISGISSQTGKLFLLYSSHFITTYILLSSYYLPQVFINSKYEARSIDYLIINSMVINQFVFLFFDISLFPLFFFECVLAIISLKTKNSIIRFFIYLIIFLPFGLYAQSLVKYSNINELCNFAFSDLIQIFSVSLVIYPYFLIYFRLLTSMKQILQTKKRFLKFTAYFSLFIFSSVIIICLVFIPKVKKLNPKSFSPKITEFNTDVISYNYSDKNLFNNKMRTLKLYLPDNCIQCEVKIENENGKAILYSSDEYEIDDNNNTYFLIPYSPPKQLTFIYGTEDINSIIYVKAWTKENIFSKTNNEEFSLYKKSITINSNGH